MLMGYQTTYPFPFAVIDNFLESSTLTKINSIITNMQTQDSTYKFIDPTWEKNKYAFERNFEPELNNLFQYLNSEEFIFYLEELTGIKNLIRNDVTLKGAGVHKTYNDGFLSMHTDFNTYDSEEYGALDRRINLLLYFNEDWKDSYNGDLLLSDISKYKITDKISPTFNRCVIFNTSKKSLHGHPVPLNVPENVSRNSIAVYYYTKSVNGLDFDGDQKRSTFF
jgi:Rps23 Pro-64 3,4-dihydroxylase Tpa1-like proline 4-hydroxylase